MNGTLAIGDIDPTLISGFPGISVSLKNVSLKDSLWQKHRHTLLQAGDVDVSVNALALLGGTVDINKITINNAAIDLFTDSTGYSNTAVFGKKKTIKEDQPKEESSSSAIIKKINFNKVSFTMDNRKAYKLFKFEVNSLKGKVNYPSTGWEADITLDTRIKSLAFNTKRGSFVKDKQLSGPFDIKYSNQTKVITVAPNKLNIGGDDFVIGARFDTGKDPVQFKIDIQVDELLWSHASALLAPNITVKLNMFNLAQPLWVHTVLNGDFGGGGDPAIDVNCKVRNTSLSGPGGKADNCSFDGVFTNHNVKGKGMNDENSAIKLYNFTGNYQQMPFTIDTAIIENLISPIASGNFKSNFGLTNLNAVTGGEPLKFTNGTASLNLKYKADIVDFQIHKPMLAGIISIKNADMTYVPRNLNLKNTSLSINFKGDDLLLNDIRLQSGRSVVMMNGKVSNFLNLYYNAPEKMLLTWYIRSPQMYLGEFLGVLN
ncbi:MAG: AsmA family protein, partial [Sphingobacteriales bacterium]